MKWGVITLFPEMFEAINQYGVVGRAFQHSRKKNEKEQNITSLQCWNPRDFTSDKHQTVDDRPYGGGPGMVMKIKPLALAVEAAKSSLSKAKVIYLSPQGKTLNQQVVKEFSLCEEIILVAGRYEGVDERFVETYVDEEWSIGDYVLSGGELAAMVLIDATVRLLPDVLGHDQSAEQDSFSEGLLDYPHYTRPEQSDIGEVPEVLLSGNHKVINEWRLKQALGRTQQRRPDLLDALTLSEQEKTLVKEFLDEFEH